MPIVESFISAEEDELAHEFLSKGYVVRPVENASGLAAMREAVVNNVAEYLEVPRPEDEGRFLDTIHTLVPIEKLNGLRMHVFGKLNRETWFRPTYFSLAKNTLESLVGNELAMQSKANLSIQMPNDTSSLLSVHADTWSEESPFQVVLWIPLVNVYDTKSMYILPPEYNRTVIDRLPAIAKTGGAEKLFEVYRDQFVWVNVNYGEALLFSPNLLHGNVVNATAETRWSMNCRFKGLFTPYMSEEKKLGSFFLPITTKIATRIGINYKLPERLDD